MREKRSLGFGQSSSLSWKSTVAENSRPNCVMHMHGELFKSRCDSCSRPPFADTNIYEPLRGLPWCDCCGGIRPHICWFGEVPFNLDRIFRALDECTIFGCRHIRRGRTRRKLRRSRRRACANNLRRIGRTRERLLGYGMSFG